MVLPAAAENPDQPDKVLRSGVRRAIVERATLADCLICDFADASSWAIARATAHIRATGHTVRGKYAASYIYLPADVTEAQP